MSASTLISGTPAGLTISDLDINTIQCQTLTADFIVSDNNITADGYVNAPLVQNFDPVNPTVTTLGNNIAGSTVALSANSSLVVDTSASVNVLLAETATVGTNAGTTTPLLVVGPGAPGPVGSVVFDKVMNPAFVQWYAPATTVFPANMPSASDPALTLLHVTVPAAAQNAKFIVVNFNFIGSQSVNAIQAQGWQIYLTNNEFSAFNPANANALGLIADAGTPSPVIWNGITTPSTSSSLATIYNGLVSCWFKPSAAVTDLYLTVKSNLGTTVGGQLLAGFAADAICVAYN